VIDYAHTPDALASALASLRRHCAQKLWVVFGCGGDRDRGKRAEMGAIAARLADCVVLTDDNPRNEDGDSIITDILEGIERGDIRVMRNRREAIRYALDGATPPDMVLIAGKGHEATQEIQGVKYPFNDRKVVEDILQEIKRV
jgi:UDP-N-acetylmuramoyl-L-alanyl-D-glutamate--2,6-diaminopimelate ligase